MRVALTISAVEKRVREECFEEVRDAPARFLPGRLASPPESLRNTHMLAAARPPVGPAIYMRTYLT